MIEDKISLYELVNDSIDRYINQVEELNPNFSGYLKKDALGFYSLVDVEDREPWSIKCIFSEGALNNYSQAGNNYLNYETFENYQINLKKYHFDFLIVEVNQFSLAFRVVCYIDDFEIDNTRKVDLESIPTNVNLDVEIMKKVDRAVSQFLKKHQDEYYSQVTPKIFKANNFLTGKFKEESENVERNFHQIENVEGEVKLNSVFEIIRKLKNIQNNNFLVKANVSLDLAWPYVKDLQEETKTIEQVRNFDYTPIYVSQETQKDKEKGKEFLVSNTNRLNFTSTGMINESHLKPSDLYLDVEDSTGNIQQFLLKKVKRHRPSRDTQNLPDSIKELVNTYGDICANINYGVVKKYQYYQKFYNFSLTDREN